MTLIICPEQPVEEAWIDYNGHMNMAFYNVAFDRAVDHFYDQIGIGEDYLRDGGSVFTVEVHLHYLQELSLGDHFQIHLRLLDFDEKRVHFFEEMRHATTGELCATSEQLGLHVSMSSRRSAPFPSAVLDRLEPLLQAHRALPTPPQVGHRIGIQRRKAEPG